MNELFQSIRESCSTATWSKAVELVRSGEFAAIKTADCINVNIRIPDASIHPIVSLFVEDLDWQCTCTSDENPCHHVAAAIISIRRAREKGQDLPQASESTGHLEYHFQSEQQSLVLKRLIVSNASGPESWVLNSTLSALTSGRVKGPAFISTPTDMEIDVLIGTDYCGIIPQAKAHRLVKFLIDGDCKVFVDKQPVTPKKDSVGFTVVVSDDGPGIRVTAEKTPGLEKIYNNGFALVSPDNLHPAIVPKKSPMIENIIKSGVFFARQEFGSFVSNVLPILQENYPIAVRSKQLPKQGYGKPRLEIHLTDQYPEGLRATPSIVYGDPVDTRIHGGQISHFGDRISIRSVDEELVLKDELWRAFGLILGESILLSPLDASAFIAKLGRTSKFSGDITGDGFEAWSILGAIEPVIEWQEGQREMPCFSFQLSKGDQRHSATNAAVITAWSNNEPLVRLTGGGFAVLPTDWLAKNGHLLSWLHSRDDLHPLGTAAKITLQRNLESLGLVPPQTVTELKERFQQSRSALPLPQLNAQLRPYQSDGIEWLHTLADSGQGGILADDMGLGKTLQAISLLSRPSLIVAPTSVVFNWQREIERFRPGLKVCLYHGRERSIAPDVDVVITSYNLVRLFPQDFARTWDVVIADEAQLIKNPDSQIFSVMCTLKAKAKFALTGTPIENRLDDLWAQMEFVNPGLLGSKRYFSESVAAKIRQNDQAALGYLRQRIKPYFLRRLKTEVAKDLPDRTNIVRPVELSDKEQQLYDAILQKTRSNLEEKAGEQQLSAMHILELLLRLRQVCCHPNLLPDTSGFESSKVNFVADMMTTLVDEGHKILLFSQWTSYLDLIADKLLTLNLKSLRLDGSTTNRREIVDCFQDPASTEHILLMSLKAGGTGLNLTAADHVFIMDPWWNPAAEEQASNRAWRIGQTKPVFVHKIVAANTIEEKILQLQDAKQQLSDAVTGGDFAQAPTLKEILAMLT